MLKRQMYHSIPCNSWFNKNWTQQNTFYSTFSKLYNYNKMKWKMISLGINTQLENGSPVYPGGQ